MSEPPPTFFTICHVPGRRLARLCFGPGSPMPPGPDDLAHGRRVRLGPERRVFAALWWERKAAADEQWRSVAVLRADPSGGRRVPDVSGAVQVLGVVGQSGPPGTDGAVDRVLELIADVVAAGFDPSRLPADYWRAAVLDVQFGRRPAGPKSTGRRRPRRPRLSAHLYRTAA